MLNPFNTIGMKIAGGVALILAAMLAVQTLRLKSAQADLKSARADLAPMTISRDAWKAAAGKADLQASSWKAVAQRRSELLAECQFESLRIGKANRAAVAAAETARQKAEADKALWRRNYENIIGQPKCAQARAAYDAACPIGAY